MKLNTIDEMTEELALSLIDKHIHFTYHDRNDNTIHTMPGTVLDYENGKIKIDTMDITYDDWDNSLVRVFNLEDITDIFPFSDKMYNHNFLELFEDLEFEDLNKTKYKIQVFDDIFITTTIKDVENFPLSILISIDGKDCEIPVYFIKSAKKVSD